MADNRSLDEFLGGEASDEPAGNSDGPDTGQAVEEPAEATDSSVDERGAGEPADGEPAADAAPETVDPMAETFAWSPDGGECAACGGTVDERWRDGDALVCGECKAW